jgi:tetratricopeptide (TPR) repeat protein
MRLVFGLAVFLAIDVSARLAGAPAPRQLDYRALVESYQTGGSRVADQVAAAPPRELEAWVERAVSDRAGAWDWQAIRAAAILHTELWYRAVVEKRDDSARDHLNAALRLFERLRQVEPRQIEYIDRWRQLMTSALPAMMNAVEAGNFATRTAAAFPLDLNRQLATRAFANGLEAERLGAERLARSGPLTMGENSSMRWWAAAVSSYSDALKHDRTFGLASLHLGRVRMLQGAGDDAATHFERATDAADPRVRYLAHLFLGSLAERKRHDADAERSYLSAMKTYPLGQAALLALSQLLSRTGREADGRQVLALLSSRKGGSVEPLWTYLPSADPGPFDHQMLLDELRAEVRK